MSFQIVVYEDVDYVALYRDGVLVEDTKDDYLGPETLLNLSNKGWLVEPVDAMYSMKRDVYDDFEQRDVEPWPQELSEILSYLEKLL